MPQVTTEFEVELLGHVQERPYLFDLRHGDYKDNKLKQNAWDEIGILMNKPGQYYNLIYYH